MRVTNVSNLNKNNVSIAVPIPILDNIFRPYPYMIKFYKHLEKECWFKELSLYQTNGKIWAPYNKDK